MAKKTRGCECEGCQRDRRVISRVNRMRPEASAFWLDIYSELQYAELDRDVNQAIIDGSWPDADKIIEYARAKVKTCTT